MTTDLDSSRVVPPRKYFQTVPSPHRAGKQTMCHRPCRTKESIGTIIPNNMGDKIVFPQPTRSKWAYRRFTEECKNQGDRACRGRRVPRHDVRTCSAVRQERRYLGWCRRRDLNPHGLRHTPLKRACLPFHHFGDRIREAYLVQAVASCLSFWFHVSSFSSRIAEIPRWNLKPETRNRQPHSQTTSQREVHYRSGPKSLSINRGSGRI